MTHNWQHLQLLEVAADTPHLDPAAAAAGGSSSGSGNDDSHPPTVLVAPLEALEVEAQQGQVR